MGWTYPHTTYSRRELIDYILRDHNEPSSFEILDHSQRGNELYVLVHEVAGNTRYIQLYLLRSEQGRWGYKDLTEHDYPSYFGCSERLLKQSTCRDERAIKWRDACRQSRKAKKDLQKRIAEISLYAMLKMEDGSIVTLVGFYSPTFFIGKDENGDVWRYYWRHVNFKQTLETPLDY